MKRKETILIVALKYRAAFISHMIANYKQLVELGYRPVLYIHKDFIQNLPSGIDYISSFPTITNLKYAIFWSPSLNNIFVMIRLRLFKRCKICYVYHEPLEKNVKAYIKSQNSIGYIISVYIKNFASKIMLALSNKTLLPSKKAINLYEKSIIDRFLCHHYFYLPLMYDDEPKGQNIKRKYFSYIGGINRDHAFEAYIGSIFYIYKNNLQRNYSFLIASRNKLEITPKISEMIEKGILIIKCGKQMSNEEINLYYQESLIVWNAYNRTTQSGVLAKAFLFGTPAIILRQNFSEFVIDKKNVYMVDDHNPINILEGVNFILMNYDSFSKQARSTFEHYFYYKSSNSMMSRIIND